MSNLSDLSDEELHQLLKDNIKLHATIIKLRLEKKPLMLSELLADVTIEEIRDALQLR